MLSQYQLINKILTDGKFSIVTDNNLTTDHFFNYKNEFEFIKNHVKAYGSVPEPLTFAAQFPDFELQEVKEADSALVANLLKDYKTNKMAEIFNYVKENIESDIDPTVILENVSKSINNLNREGTAFKATDITSIAAIEESFKRYENKIIHKDDLFLSTGLKELDEVINGIDTANENMVISARTGIGKSWLLMIIAAAAVMQGKRVGFYSGEMSLDKVTTRIHTILAAKYSTQIADKVVYTYNFTNTAINRGDEGAYDEYKKFLDFLIEKSKAGTIGSLKVLTPNDINGPATVDALRAFVEKEDIEVLLIDQYSLLEDTSKSRIMHERVANISKDVKNLQVMKQIPIISVSQNNRTGEKDKDTGQVTQDTTQLALSDRIGQDATTILMLDRIKDKQSDKDILKINVLKARDGGDGTELLYDADFNRGRFTFIQQAVNKEEAKKMQDDYKEQETVDSTTGEVKQFGGL